MKKSAMLAAVAAIGLASAAVADNYDPSLDVTLDLGSFTLVSPANGGSPVSFVVESGPSGVVGYSFSGVASGITGNGTWASDTQMRIFLAGELIYTIGGFPSDAAWAFDGPQSNDDGFYAQPITFLAKDDPVPGGLQWEIQFLNGWNSASSSPITWSDVNFTIHRIPAPGAVALLALAGLAGSRRRG